LSDSKFDIVPPEKYSKRSIILGYLLGTVIELTIRNVVGEGRPGILKNQQTYIQGT
jgi:hypothetical protein